jgi:pimeloyl-ACP methyl ester carboxylesterase
MNPRKYGNPPFSVAVVHGGPGAPGEMAPVARELSTICGVLEPLQTKFSIEDQIHELQAILENDGDLPVTLIGYSWGAWLSCLLASYYPALVRKLILVSSGAFEEKYVIDLMDNRLRRLDEEKRLLVNDLMKILNNPKNTGSNAAFAQFGELMAETDNFSPLPAGQEEGLEVQGNIFQSIWPEAAELRRSGQLLRTIRQINCPVLAIHGDYDPTPADGVQKPLAQVINNFKFILLSKCGHTPWIERHAKDMFYEIIKNELKQVVN